MIHSWVSAISHLTKWCCSLTLCPLFLWLPPFYLPFFLPEGFPYGRKPGNGCPPHAHTHIPTSRLPPPLSKKGQKLRCSRCLFFCWWSIATYELKHHPEADIMDLIFCTVCRAVKPNLAKIYPGLFKTGCLFVLNLATHSEGTEATAYSPGWLWPFVIASTHNES